MVTIIDICDDMIRIKLCVFLLQETTKEEGQAGDQKSITGGGDPLSCTKVCPLLVCLFYFFSGLCLFGERLCNSFFNVKILSFLLLSPYHRPSDR